MLHDHWSTNGQGSINGQDKIEDQRSIKGQGNKENLVKPTQKGLFCLGIQSIHTIISVFNNPGTIIEQSKQPCS